MDTSTLAAFRDYVETHTARLIDPAFFNFKTAMHVSHLPNNKGKMTVQVGKVNSNITGPWKALTYADANKNTTLIPVQVETERTQFAEGYVPEELENTYLGFIRQTGQDPTDFPLEGYMLDLIAKQIAQDNEIAFWQAVKVVAPTTLKEQFDGVLKQLSDAITAGDVTVVTLGTPFIPRNNEQAVPVGQVDMVDLVENLVLELPEEIQQEGVEVYMSTKNKKAYDKTYRNRFGTTQDGTRMDLGRDKLDSTSDMGEINVIGVPGMGNSNRVIATPIRNIWYTYDVAEDASTFNFDNQMNQLYTFGSYRFGAKVLMMDDNWIACNELA